MDKKMIGFILSSLETWKENDKVGEEVRLLESEINFLLIIDIDPVLEFLQHLIEKYKDDEMLGKQIRKNYIPLKLYYENKTTIS